MAAGVVGVDDASFLASRRRINRNKIPAAAAHAAMAVKLVAAAPAGVLAFRAATPAAPEEIDPTSTTF